jgi:SAM-dependent methyltransferase
MDFSRRSAEAELMDTEAVGYEEFRACLVDLARVNRITFAYRPTLAFFDGVLRRARALRRPLEVLDVGSGYGDTLRQVHRWALRHKVPVSLTGVDLNPWAARAAAEATPRGCAISWVTADAFAYAPPRGIDVVVSSLFAHHLPDPSVAKFLRFMESTATLGWFVNDLRRHPVPYHFFQRFSKLTRLHRFVQHDGPVSIARAFTSADWRQLLATAGLDQGAARIMHRAPFRLTVERHKIERHETW